MTDKTQPTAHAEITAPISADLRRMSGDEQPEALQQSAQPDALAEVSKEQYARMFNAACEALGQISDHLGIDSDIDPGAEPIIEAIDELRAAALQAAPPAPAAVAVPEALAADARRLAYVADQVRALEAVGSDSDVFLTEAADVLRACANRIAAPAAAPAQAYSIDADPQGIRAYVADAITGALACGAQGSGTPPPDHWLTPFWRQARFGQIQYNALRDATDALLNAPGAAQEHATQLAGQEGEQDEGLAQAIDERDTAEGWADGLAGLIGAYFGQDIGEHSSAHNPWQEAKDIIEEAEPYRSATAAPAQAQEDAAALEAPAAPAGLDDSELEDLAHSANQECLSSGMSLDPFLRLAKTVRDRALAAAPQAPAAPAVDARAERDAAFEAVRNRLCGLQRYSFVLDDDGVVRRAQDRTGHWIEFDDAHELFDPVAVDAAIAAQAKGERNA